MKFDTAPLGWMNGNARGWQRRGGDERPLKDADEGDLVGNNKPPIPKEDVVDSKEEWWRFKGIFPGMVVVYPACQAEFAGDRPSSLQVMNKPHRELKWILIPDEWNSFNRWLRSLLHSDAPRIRNTNARSCRYEDCDMPWINPRLSKGW